MSPGFRASFCTLARQNGHVSLDHVHHTEVVKTFDRGHRRPDRVKLMILWRSSWWRRTGVKTWSSSPVKWLPDNRCIKTPWGRSASSEVSEAVSWGLEPQ